MTEQEIAELSPSFSSYLDNYKDCFDHPGSATHFSNYCHGLLTDLPRKSVEPIALLSGTTVRTLQAFITTYRWDHQLARRIFQESMAKTLADLPSDDLGVVGVIDETSCRKWGDKTPGVQRQYLGCVGKIDNGIVTVHIAAAKETFQALLDADLFLPKDWAGDRERCRKAGIPNDVDYQSKWRIALDQLIRLKKSGVIFDWLTFDEYYGSKVPFLWILNETGQRYVAEVPKNFTVRESEAGRANHASKYQSGESAKSWPKYTFKRKTLANQEWRAKCVKVWAARGWNMLVTAVNERTGEVKYFVTNAVDEPLERILRVAFRRATVEHGFRLAKQEAGMMHYEGRDYTGLMRHLILVLLTLGFVAEQTQRLRGEKSRSDRGAGVSGFEPAMRRGVSKSARHFRRPPCERSDQIPPEAQQTGSDFPQKAAA